MKITKLFALILLFIGSKSYAQNSDLQYTMGYHSIDIIVKNKLFLNSYSAPGKDAVCGFYSSYNNTIYLNNSSFLKEVNPDYLFPATEKCIDTLSFDNSPRPYAMMEFDVVITKVDYETNTIYAKTDGADLIITTFNKEIDAFYDIFYKDERLGAVQTHLILKNWSYKPESEDSFETNTAKANKKLHYKGQKAKNEEQLLHPVEYQKED